jgi:uncharacterized membrane protein
MAANTVRSLTRAGLIAALYAALTLIFAPISYGPLQVRISEALTILPYFTPSAIIGLGVGCLAANIYSSAGIYDVILGSLLTLMAAYLTYLCGRSNLAYLAPLPPVILNALGVSSYLQFFYDPPQISFLGEMPAYWLFVLTIGAGEIVACYALGMPLLLLIRNTNLRKVLGS